MKYREMFDQISWKIFYKFQKNFEYLKKNLWQILRTFKNISLKTILNKFWEYFGELRNLYNNF